MKKNSKKNIKNSYLQNKYSQIPTNNGLTWEQMGAASQKSASIFHSYNREEWNKIFKKKKKNSYLQRMFNPFPTENDDWISESTEIGGGSISHLIIPIYTFVKCCIKWQWIINETYLCKPRKPHFNHIINVEWHSWIPGIPGIQFWEWTQNHLAHCSAPMCCICCLYTYLHGLSKVRVQVQTQADLVPNRRSRSSWWVVRTWTNPPPEHLEMPMYN
jgi:hypothetical protein